MSITEISMFPTREVLLKGKAQYSGPPHLERLFSKKEKCGFSIKAADLN
jgi:hypothetical protein